VSALPTTRLFSSLSEYSGGPSISSSRLTINLRPQLLMRSATALPDSSAEPDPEPSNLLTLKPRRTFLQLLDHVQVEGDGDEGGIVPFELWDHLYEAAKRWSSHTRDNPASEILLKARQVGISTLAQAYALFVAMERHANVLVISKTLEDSKDFGRKLLVIYDNLPSEWREVTTTRNTEQVAFAGGGRIQFKAPSQDAGRGTANALVIIDEAAFQPWAGTNYRAYRPTIAAGGQLLVISTANGVSNWFARTYWKAKKRAMPYLAVFLPWNVRPGRDAKWLANEKAAFEGDPDDFGQEYPSTEAEAFVAKTGIVFPQFNEQLHMREGDPVRWEDCEYRVISADYGGGDPTAVAAWGVYKVTNGAERGQYRVHGFGLFYRPSGAVTVDEMAGFIAPWHERAPISIGQMEHDATVNASLATLIRGVQFEAADKRRGTGLGTVAMFLSNNWVTFNAVAFAQISHEFASYRWLHRLDPNDKDRYATGTPVDHHADILDCLRYALMYIYYRLMKESAPPRKTREVRY